MSKKTPSTSRCLIRGNLHEKRWTFWPQRNLVGKPRSLPLNLSVKPFWLGFCQSPYFSRAVKMSKKPLCTGGCHIGGNLHEKRWTFQPQCNLVGIHHSNLAAGPLNSL